MIFWTILQHMLFWVFLCRVLYWHPCPRSPTHQVLCPPVLQWRSIKSSQLQALLIGGPCKHFLNLFLCHTVKDCHGQVHLARQMSIGGLLGRALIMQSSCWTWKGSGQEDPSLPLPPHFLRYKWNKNVTLIIRSFQAVLEPFFCYLFPRPLCCYFVLVHGSLWSL